MRFKKIIYSSAVILGGLSLLLSNQSVLSATTNVATTNSINTTSETSNWIDLGTHTNVDLNKVWTVNFSNTVALNKIDTVVVKSGNLFVPVTITKNAQKQLKVSPTLGYTGNTDYEMKIILSNGLKYKMTFTTKNAARNTDKEPNDTHVHAQTIYSNDHVKGNLSREDSSDYYKVNIPADGKFQLTAISTNGEPLDLYLYGGNGNDYSAIRYNYNAVTNNLSAGLQAGTYYIRIADNNVNNYELTTTFTENVVENDNASSTYIQAKELPLNSETTGHLGFTNDNLTDNENDYYKIVLKENGTFVVEATQLDGGELDMYIYGKNGHDQSAIRYEYNVTSHKFTVGLQAGTYYIRLHDSGYYGAYQLKNSFTPETVPNDNATSNYITAPEIAVNTTIKGHIGHTNENVSDNENDYYKVSVNEAGTLYVHAKHLQGRELDVYLYGEYGTDRSALDYEYNVKQETISAKVIPGNYYIRLYDSGYYGTYELSTELIK